MLDCDQYLTPASLPEAFDLMARHRGDCRLVAGATDLLPWARQGRGGNVRYGALIDLGGLPELEGFRREGGRIRMGANTTIGGFLHDPLLRKALPVLAKTAVWFADEQIREQATLGGNIVNASPAADTFPALMALNAIVVLASPQAGGVVERELALEDFVLAPGKTALGEGEIMTAVICDAPEGYGSAFEKVGQRRSLVLSTVCLAALVRLNGAGTHFEDVRLGLAAVAPVPLRLKGCETYLVGKEVSETSVAEAAGLAAEAVASRTRREYRREVLGNFVQRTLAGALADLGVPLRGGAREQPEVAHG